MELSKQVVSLELAQKLKELGVEQSSFFSWYVATDRDDTPGLNKSPEYHCDCCGHPMPPYITSISAFTVAELGEMLPQQIRAINPNNMLPENYFLHFWYCEDGWYIEYSTPKKLRGNKSYPTDMSHCSHWEESKNEADCRAKMLIYLLKNDLLPPHQK